MLSKIRLVAAAAASVLIVPAASNAAVLGWNFTDLDAVVDTGTPTGFTAGSFVLGNSFGTVTTPVNATSPSGVYAGASAGGNIGNAVNIGALSTSTSAYYSVTLTPTAGNAVTITDIDFGSRSTGTGPATFSVRSSVDSFGSELVGGTIPTTSAWTFFNNTSFSVTGATNTAVELRVYTFGGTGSPGSGTQNNRVDDIALTAVAVPEPTSLAGGIGLGGLLLLRRRRQA